MIRVKVFSIGKTKERWLLEAIEEYEKRLQQKIIFDFIWAKDNVDLVSRLEKEPAYILLDQTGELMTSERFARFLFEQIEKQGARICFVIGGAEGLPAQLKMKAPMISFSDLTFTHQIIRLLLVEQIYRATEIEKGSSYHK